MSRTISSLQILLAGTILFIVGALCCTATAQISHGGKPIPMDVMPLSRSLSSGSELYVEMPAISNEAELWRSSEEGSTLRSMRFAHKFHRFLRPDNSGVTFQWNNMNVWRVGIRSKGAYSLNILFSKFNLPPGAMVFVYNGNQTEVLGSFTEENNSNLNMLPVQPIGGDELIVEYQEPINALFKGEIEVGEINHDFRGILSATEPRDPNQECHPNIACYAEDVLPGSGVVVLIINGDTYCTGSLVNNTANDGTPYLLTATHCLNNDYSFDKGSYADQWKKYGSRGSWHYNEVSGSIVAFFNYQSPVCPTDIRGPLQMTLASSDSVLISERHDISLLRLKENPPAYYQPYFLGWNVSASPQAPFHGIHHPNGGIKKVAVEESGLTITSFYGSKYNMEPNSHWAVRAWDVGATEGGSSGSPLLNKEKQIVGTLTGGTSYCSSPRGPDQYASLSKFWHVQGSLNNPNPISFYLDPKGTQATELEGYEPHADNPYTRSMNLSSDESPIETLYQSIPMFATHNAFGYSEFAEEFHSDDKVQLEGVFVSSPANSNMLNNDIRIRVYRGENGPEQLVHEQPYNYSFLYRNTNGFLQEERDMHHSVENYIAFDRPITLTGTFYIAYTETNGTPNGFTVFNATPRAIGSGKTSTAWIKDKNEWMRSSEHIENPINSSLMIVPYLIGKADVSVKPISEAATITVYYEREVNRVFIESNHELMEWQIFYVSGQKIYEGRAEKSMNRASFSVDHFPKGVYIVKVKTLNGTQDTKKVLVM